MREFNEFSALLRAPAFSRAFYVDVATRWRGIALRYLLLLLALTWLVALIRTTGHFSDFLANDAPAMLKTFPPITIAKGQASSPVAQPYIFKDEQGNLLFVLDTTGKTQIPSELGADVLVTKTEVVQESRFGGRIQRQPLGTLPDMTIDGSTILSWMRKFRNGLIPIGWPVLTAISLGYRLLVALLYALIGLALNAIFQGHVTFGGLFRLSVVAMTTVILFDTLLGVLSFDLGCFAWLLYPLVSLAYLIFGTWAAADATRALPPIPLDSDATIPPPALSNEDPGQFP